MSISVAAPRINLSYLGISLIVAVLMGYKFGALFALAGLPAYPVIALLDKLYDKLPQRLHPIAPWVTLLALFILCASLMIVAGKAMAETIDATEKKGEGSGNPFSASDETVASVGRIYVMFQHQLAERTGKEKFDKLAWMKAMQDCSSKSAEPTITEGIMEELASCADLRAAEYSNLRPQAEK